MSTVLGQNHLVVPDYEKYKSIIDGEKTTITMWSKYFTSIYPCIDEIAIDFQKNKIMIKRLIEKLKTLRLYFVMCSNFVGGIWTNF